MTTHPKACRCARCAAQPVIDSFSAQFQALKRGAELAGVELGTAKPVPSETGDFCAHCGHREGQHCETYSGFAGCCAACIQFSPMVCTTFRAPAKGCAHLRTRHPLSKIEWCCDCGAYRLYGPDSWVRPGAEARADEKL